MEQWKNTLSRSVDLGRTGNLDEAIELVKSALREAVESNDAIWVVTLARHAAVLSDAAGALSAAEQYYQLALRHSNEDPMLHFALADLYKRQGNEELALRHADSCRQLASIRSDQDVNELIASRKDLFPANGKLE
jgi:tetratricopeptide (TPR) repeat protein